MPAKSQTYEQPLNERIRTCLRVETLMQRFHYFSGLKGDWSGYSALLGILEITALLERGNLKQELLKELERQHSALKALASKEGVDKAKLDLVLSKQRNAIDQIHRLSGKLGIHIKQVDFLLTIKQRTSIPGGSCDFDLPQLGYWLSQTHAQRLSDLKRWATPYLELESVIGLILSVIRDSSTPKQVIAEKGFFQQSLVPQHSSQLVRITLPAGKPFYPEISAGKHRFSVRFLSSQSIDEVPSQVKDDVPFLLSRCSL